MKTVIIIQLRSGQHIELAFNDPAKAKKRFAELRSRLGNARHKYFATGERCVLYLPDVSAILLRPDEDGVRMDEIEGRLPQGRVLPTRPQLRGVTRAPSRPPV